LTRGCLAVRQVLCYQFAQRRFVARFGLFLLLGIRHSWVLSKGLTPELTGAGGPIGPQGTNIGHQNREAMANVGVRVERFVRLVRKCLDGGHSQHLDLAALLHLLPLFFQRPEPAPCGRMPMTVA
jgi:hypothetical protein